MLDALGLLLVSETDRQIAKGVCRMTGPVVQRPWLVLLTPVIVLLSVVPQGLQAQFALLGVEPAAGNGIPDGVDTIVYAEVRHDAELDTEHLGRLDPALARA